MLHRIVHFEQSYWLPGSLLVVSTGHKSPVGDSLCGVRVRVFRMRTGISFTVSPTDRARLMALIGDRNTPQKHVWRAEIVLLSADGVGTVADSDEAGH